MGFFNRFSERTKNRTLDVIVFGVPDADISSLFTDVVEELSETYRPSSSLSPEIDMDLETRSNMIDGDLHYIYSLRMAISSICTLIIHIHLFEGNSLGNTRAMDVIRRLAKNAVAVVPVFSCKHIVNCDDSAWACKCVELMNVYYGASGNYGKYVFVFGGTDAITKSERESIRRDLIESCHGTGDLNVRHIFVDKKDHQDKKMMLWHIMDSSMISAYERGTVTIRQRNKVMELLRGWFL